MQSKECFYSGDEAQSKNKRPIQSIGKRCCLQAWACKTAMTHCTYPTLTTKLGWWYSIRAMGLSQDVGSALGCWLGREASCSSISAKHHPRMFAQRTSSLGVLIRDTVTSNILYYKDQRPRRNCWPGNFFRGETVCGLFHIYPLPLSLTWC